MRAMFGRVFQDVSIDDRRGILPYGRPADRPKSAIPGRIRRNGSNK